VFRWQMLVAAAVAVVGAASLGYVFRSDGSTDQEMELIAAESAASGNGTFAFTVQATPVEGLYPGAVRKLKLTLTNPYTFDLQMTAIRAELVATSNAGCAPVATNLEIAPYTGTLPVKVSADDSRAAGSVPLHMPNTVANDCQKAVFTIKLSADATRVGR
jgi:hypothetical protein